MAPEMLATFKVDEVDPDTYQGYTWKADVYSFGVICSEILTGKRPFDDIQSCAKLLAAVHHGVRPPLPDSTPYSLKSLIEDCWNTDPGKRLDVWEIRERLWKCRLLFKFWEDAKAPPSSSQGFSTLIDRLQQRASSQAWEGPVSKIQYKPGDLKRSIIPLSSEPSLRVQIYEKLFTVKTHNRFAVKARIHCDDALKTKYDILNKCCSPYIVGVVAYWRISARSEWNMSKLPLCPFLLMECLEFNFKDLVDRRKSEGNRGRFSALETINLMLPIAKALRFLNEKDVAHGDLKPENIMFKNLDQLEKIGDAIVKLAGCGSALENVSSWQLALRPSDLRGAGTLGYIDPSWYQAGRHGYILPFMGDVFSFAMVFAELLTCKSPSEAFGVRNSFDAQGLLNTGMRPPLPDDLPGYDLPGYDLPGMRPPLPDDLPRCLMLENAKISLSDVDFVDNSCDLFSYLDATGEYRYVCCVKAMNHRKTCIEVDHSKTAVLDLASQALVNDSRSFSTSRSNVELGQH